MTATTGDRLLTEYLARLDAAALRLPPDRRADLMEGIAEHVAAARAAGELRNEAAVRTLLDRLGEPEEIVAAATEEQVGGGLGPPPWGAGAPQLVPRRPGTGLETAAVLMLTVGSLLPLVGWLVGVVLLWTSKRWRTWEKLVGTLVVPGGPAGVLWLGGLAVGSESCTTSVSGSLGVEVFEGPGVPPGQAPPTAVTETTVCESTGGVLSGGDLPDWAYVGLLAFAVLGPFVVAVLLLRRARARAAAEPPELRSVGGSPWGGLEVAAVLLLGLGSFVVPVLGTVAGLVLLWMSPRWTSGEKGFASALVLLPVALIALYYGVAIAGAGVFAFGIIGGVLLFAFGPLIAAGYLAVVLNRRQVR